MRRCDQWHTMHMTLYWYSIVMCIKRCSFPVFPCAEKRQSVRIGGGWFIIGIFVGAGEERDVVHSQEHDHLA